MCVCVRDIILWVAVMFECYCMHIQYLSCFAECHDFVVVVDNVQRLEHLIIYGIERYIVLIINIGTKAPQNIIINTKNTTTTITNSTSSSSSNNNNNVQLWAVKQARKQTNPIRVFCTVRGGFWQ